MITIAVPIYGEEVATLARLIRSIKLQEGIDLSEVRVACLINNDLDADQKVRNLNQACLSYLRQPHGLNLIAIDRSSVGKELKGCNVGKARQALLWNEYIHYLSNKSNGLIFHIDADSHFEDTMLLKKILITCHNREVIGVTGGKHRKVYIDKYRGKYTRDEIIRVFREISLAKQCKELTNFINGERVHEAFGGSNMISRCFESIGIGGFQPLSVGEDKDFGRRLTEYALKNGKKIVNLKTTLKVAAEMRLSGRTGSSFVEEAERVLKGENLHIRNFPLDGSATVSNYNYRRLSQEASSLKDGPEAVKYIEDYGKIEFI